MVFRMKGPGGSDRAFAGWTSRFAFTLCVAALVLGSTEQSAALPDVLHGSWGFHNTAGGEEHVFLMEFGPGGGEIRHGYCEFAVGTERIEGGFRATLKRGPEICRREGLVTFYRDRITRLSFRWGDAAGEWLEGTHNGEVLLGRRSPHLMARFAALYPELAEGEDYPAPRVASATVSCAAYFDVVKGVIDTFGVDAVKRDRQIPRYYNALLPDQFAKFSNAPLDRLSYAAATRLRNEIEACARRDDPFRGLDSFYANASRSLLSIVTMLAARQDLPPVQRFRQLAALDRKMREVLEDGFGPIERSLAGYEAALRTEVDARWEFAPLLPSAGEGLFATLRAEREELLQALIAEAVEEMADMRAEVDELLVAIAPHALQTLDLTAAAPGEQARIADFGRLRAEAAADLAQRIVATMPGPEADPDLAVLERSRLLGRVLPIYQRRRDLETEPLRIVVQDRREAIGRLAEVYESLAVEKASTRDGLARLMSVYSEMLPFSQDREIPEGRNIADVHQRIVAAARSDFYREDCLEYLGGEAGITGDATETPVLVGDRVEPLWRFACASHERGLRIMSFERRGWFGSEYGLRLERGANRLITIVMVSGEVAPGVTALVGKETREVTTVTPLTIDEWRRLSSEMSGL